MAIFFFFIALLRCRNASQEVIINRLNTYHHRICLSKGGMFIDNQEINGHFTNKEKKALTKCLWIFVTFELKFSGLDDFIVHFIYEITNLATLWKRTLTISWLWVFNQGIASQNSLR